ncbi:MAG: PAS domain S-box protein [candidate division Zixibacteria bacterium]|nr:PAS domain S-box protein [candidate division Zixibacteria bacterium]
MGRIRNDSGKSAGTVGQTVELDRDDSLSYAILGYYRTTPDGKILSVNRALLKMLGYDSFEKLADRDMEECGYEPDYPRDKFKQKIEANGFVDGLQSAWRRRDGSFLHIRENAWVVRDEDGRIRYYEGFVEDISEQVEIYEALQESEKRFRLQYRNSPIPIFTFRRIKNDFVLIDYNHAMEEMTAGRAEDFIGQKTSQLFRGRPIVQDVLEECYRSGQKKRHEIDYDMLSTGEHKHLQVTTVFISPDLIMVQIQDDTEHEKAARALRESEERYRVISEVSSDYAFCLKVDDEGGMSLAWGTDISKITGYDLEELRAHGGWMSIVHPDDLPIKEKEVASLFEGNQYECEYRIICKNGSIRWINAYASPVMHPKTGKLMKVYGALKDVSRRKRSEEALTASERRYRQVMETATDMVSTHSATGEYLYVSPACRQLLGYEPDELIGHSAYEFFHPDDFEKIQNSHHTILEKPEAFQVQYRIRKKDGSYIWFETSSSMMRDEESGEPLQITAISRDISHRKRIEEELRAREEHYRAIWENSPIGIILVDCDCICAYANPAICRLTGYDEEELVNRDLIGLFVPADNRQEHYNRLSEVFSGNAVSQPNEINVKTKSGQDICIRYQTDMINIDGGPRFYVIMAEDITEQRKAELERIETANRYRKLADSITDIFYAIDHDFNITYWNRASEEITGIGADHAVGKNLFELFPNLKNSEIEALYMKAMQTKSAISSEPEISYRVDGRDHHFQVNAYPTDEGLSIFIRDITGQKEADKMITKRTQELESLADNAPDLIFRVDTTNRFTLVNRRLLDVFNGARRTFEGRAPREAGIPPELCEVWNACFEKVRRTGISEEVEFTYWFEGQKHYFQMRVVPEYSPEGGIHSLLSIARDVTAEHAKKEELQISHEELKTKNIALREVLDHIEEEKRQVKKDVAENIEKVILPTVRKIIRPDGKIEMTYYQMLNDALNEMASTAGGLSQLFTRLSPREVEICNLIRNDSTIQEIADTLFISTATVKKHREQIRRKLNLTNKKVNLASFLKRF